jgi:hypothetical protein
MLLRLGEVVDAPYYALFLLGPAANVIEIAAMRAGVAKPKLTV